MSFMDMLPYCVVILLVILGSIWYRLRKLKHGVETSYKYTQLGHCRAMMVMLLNRYLHDDGEITDEHLETCVSTVKHYFPNVDIKYESIAGSFQYKINIGKYFVIIDGYVKPPEANKPYFIK